MNDLYWNQENFKDLASLSDALQLDPRLKGLSRYCRTREMGLRTQALRELDDFLKASRALAVASQREIVVEILEAHRKFPDAHQFLAHPLVNGLIVPVLEEWRALEPVHPVPLREIALLRRDVGLLKESLRVNPQDNQVRATLAGVLIACVEQATHHLSESRFLGDESEASSTLAEAIDLLGSASEPDSVRDVYEEAMHLSALLADWTEFRRDPVGTFPDWCRQRGRKYSWWHIVYYDDTRPDGSAPSR